MKSDNVLELIKGYHLVIPNILLKHYRDLKLNEKELLFLSHLLSMGDMIVFDVMMIYKQLHFAPEEILNLVASLCEKKYINLVVKKDEQNLMKDYLDISFLYNKLLSYTLNEEKKEEAEDSSRIYLEIEKEFGRTLSPIEYETIKGWLDSNISEELILEALKEAVLNGVNNLKYIDKILFEWNKKGYQKASDIKKKKPSEEIIDIFDYDWLKDND